MSFGHVNLQSLLFLVSFVPSGSYVLSALSSMQLPVSRGKDLIETSQMSLGGMFQGLSRLHNWFGIYHKCHKI